MVLKRLFATALGALGLGALAAGSAFAQTPGEGNIPAPNIFDDQVTCTANLPTLMGRTPTVIPRGADPQESPLDMAIGMGTMTIDPKAQPDDDDGTYENIVFVIPPMGGNCGGVFNFGPMAIDADSDGMVNAGDTIVASADTIALAEGYSELLPKFAAVYGAPDDLMSTGTVGALTAAQKALTEGIENGLTGSALEPLQEAVDDAQEAHNKAKAIFDDAAGGSIYQAGVAEWMAKAAVTKSIDTYNMRVNAANMAQADLDALDYGNYVPLANNSLLSVVTITDGMAGDPDLAALATYANAIVGMSTVGTVDMGVTMSDDSNFDSAGRLLVPMELDDSTADDLEDVRPIVATSDNGVDDIRMRRDDYRVAADALQKLADDTREATGGTSPLQLAYDEAARRANVEANYYNGVYNAMLTDDTLQDSGVADDAETDVDESMTSIAARNGLHVAANNKRFTAEQDLRSKAAAREAATAHVAAQFSSPTSFYSQLVARRQAQKVTADRNVAKANEDGGTASEALTDAAAAAQKNLDNANKDNDAVQAQFSDEDDPTRALVQELLKNDGDDGQALVDAIGATYEKAAGAAAEAETAVNEALEGLTGEGGVIDMNTQRSIGNTEAIVELEGEVWDDDGNSRIDANETRSMENRTMIGENRTMIGENRTMITGLRTDVDSNTGRIGQNEDDILMISGHVADNRGRIEANEGAIASNMTSIGSNRSSIMDNSNRIGELSDSLDVVRAGVAASMALAGMPAINGRGISIGVGSFDGESAFAVGFQIQGEMASFKVGVTSASGATGASAGVGFQF